ncbi:histone deacetylase superfamily [Candidatus Vecturithrix granuli]|uniref:Histone deacetylase superfamily n=1 Tax=Vecturithrix granuli TaxID=1499967 RepID=A0A081C2F2_VECG1|nr:histone deacetylase superfamily [Candidatus Vecturithrix granuli]
MIHAKNSLGLIFFPAFDWAISPTHPEREERLLYTQDQLREEGVFDIEGIIEYKPEMATPEDVARTHFCFPGIDRVTTVSHFISAGGAIKAAKLVLEKQTEKAFALVRPPGHHAMKVVHGNRGFCNINIEAVMIEYIREHYGPKRIAIVDTDCHHGDGTQDIYWHDPEVLYISLHQDGRTLYPGTGFPSELGGPNALGKNINIPLPPGTSDEGFLYVIDHVVLPILQDFQPDLVINSAGQDNHYTDPITNMNFSAQGYAQLNEKLNPDIAVLEGGYSIQGALPYINAGIVLAMAGIDYSYVHEPDYNPNTLRQSAKLNEYIQQVAETVLTCYEHPEQFCSYNTEPGTYHTRQKNIFYDTDNIHEQQTEAIMVCEACSGVLSIETRSSVNPLCLGIQIPFGACERCRDEGYRVLEKARKSKKYAHISLINRRDREYLY